MRILLVLALIYLSIGLPLYGDEGIASKSHCPPSVAQLAGEDPYRAATVATTNPVRMIPVAEIPTLPPGNETNHVTVHGVPPVVADTLHQRGHKVLKALGSGGTSVVLLTEKNKQLYAVKIATKGKYNNYILKEHEALSKLYAEQKKEGLNFFLEPTKVELPDGQMALAMPIFPLSKSKPKEPARTLTVWASNDYFRVRGPNTTKLAAKTTTEATKRVLKLTSQLAAAVEFMHKHGLIHRDIKPENILMDAEGNIRIIDLGFTTPEGEYPNPEQPYSIVGTMGFLSPEAWGNVPEKSSPAMDTYAVSEIIKQLLKPHKTERKTFERYMLPNVSNRAQRAASLSGNEKMPEIKRNARTPKGTGVIAVIPDARPRPVEEHLLWMIAEGNIKDMKEFGKWFNGIQEIAKERDANKKKSKTTSFFKQWGQRLTSKKFAGEGPIFESAAWSILASPYATHNVQNFKFSTPHLESIVRGAFVIEGQTRLMRKNPNLIGLHGVHPHVQFQAFFKKTRKLLGEKRFKELQKEAKAHLDKSFVPDGLPSRLRDPG